MAKVMKLTEEAIAAGTFAMIDITGFKFSSIKIWVKYYEENSCETGTCTYGGDQVGQKPIGKARSQRADQL